MHFVERNRFATLARNAPWSMFGDAPYVYLRDTAVIANARSWSPLRPPLGRRPPSCCAAARVRGRSSKMLPTTLAYPPRPARRRPDPRRAGRALGGAAVKVAIYNAHWSTLGGGEQLAGGIASALGDEHDVDLLVEEEFDADEASERLGFDLRPFPQRRPSRGRSRSSRRPSATTCS